MNQTVAPSSTGGYTCTPSIPNGQLTNSGNLVIDGRLDIGDATEYRCTSDEINGVIVIELAAIGMYSFKLLFFSLLNFILFHACQLLPMLFHHLVM